MLPFASCFIFGWGQMRLSRWGQCALSNPMLEGERAMLSFGYVVNALGLSARRAWEKKMQAGQYPFRNKFAQSIWPRAAPRAKPRARAEGEAQAVLRVLRARGLQVTAEQEARIRACTDPTHPRVLARPRRRRDLGRRAARPVASAAARDCYRSLPMRESGRILHRLRDGNDLDPSANSITLVRGPIRVARCVTSRHAWRLAASARRMVRG